MPRLKSLRITECQDRTHGAPSAASCLTLSATSHGPEHRTKYAFDPPNRITNVLAGGTAAPSYGFDEQGRHVNGMAMQFGFRTPPAPSVFVCKHNPDKSLAHEIGHILWEHVHSDDKDNLMREDEGTLLTEELVRIMRNTIDAHGLK